MHIATDPHNLPLAPRALARGCAVTIGNFDGVHLGHQCLIQRSSEKAKTNGLPSVIITFDPHPLQVMMGDKAPPLLMSLQHKMDCFAELGADLALVMPFTAKTARVAPDDFVRHVLADCLNTRLLTVGYDYAFGKNRSGDAALLSRMGRELGYKFEQVKGVSALGDIVSSTRIRDALQRGDVQEAAELLGRPHSVEGIVERGMNRGGKLLGFPTANLMLEDDLLLPKKGVYAVLAELNPNRHPMPGVFTGGEIKYLKGVANVGINPTFGGEKLQVETHLLDFHSNIYGCPFRVHFVQRLRDEQKFAGVNELMLQISRDTQNAAESLKEIL